MSVKSDSFKMLLSNVFINTIYEVLACNINFDDGMDSETRNKYEASTEGLQIYTKLKFEKMAFEAIDHLLN